MKKAIELKCLVLKKVENIGETHQAIFEARLTLTDTLTLIMNLTITIFMSMKLLALILVEGYVGCSRNINDRLPFLKNSCLQDPPPPPPAPQLSVLTEVYSVRIILQGHSRCNVVGV